ncbi:MAG: DUF5050 domain-containing protein [Ruminococcus sp.]|jgi:hypothetical protein|nr:DUF5050 domain-containing protein [Ruminococcus sp.]
MVVLRQRKVNAMKKSRIKALAIALTTAFSMCACNPEVTELPESYETAEEAFIAMSTLSNRTTTATAEITTVLIDDNIQTETTVPPKTSDNKKTETESFTATSSETDYTYDVLSEMKIEDKDYIFGDDGLLITHGYNEKYSGNTFIFRADGEQITTKDTMAVWNNYLDYSLDNKKAAYIQSAGYQLFYISDEDMEPVFIDYYAQYFKIAPSGNGIAYSDSDEYKANLYLWDGKEKHLITEKCYEPYAFFISPDGQTVLYSQTDNGKKSWYCYTNGRSTLVGTNINPFAITDNGEIIYYMNDNAVYAQKKNEQLRLLYDMSEGEKTLTYSFNKDRTEIMYAIDDNLYISKDAEKPICILTGMEEIEGDELPHLFPDKIAKTGGSDGVYGIDSFAGTFFTNNNLYYIRGFDDGKFTAETILSDIANEGNDPEDKDHTSYDGKEMNYNISRDGRIITYLKNNVIYRYDVYEKKTETPFLITGEAQFYFPTEKGDAVYYFNTGKALYYAVPDGEKMLVIGGLMDFATHWRDFVFDDVVIDGDKLYFINEGIVWCCDGKDEVQISADGDFYTEIELQGGLIALTGLTFGNNITDNAVLTRDGTLIKTYKYE